MLVKNEQTNTSSVAWIPITAAVGGTAVVSTGVLVLAYRVKSLKKERKLLKQRIAQLDGSLSSSNTANRHTATIENELRTARDKIHTLEREILQLEEQNKKAISDERETRSQFIKMSSAFADEYQRNQEHDEEELMREVDRRNNQNTNSRIIELNP